MGFGSPAEGRVAEGHFRWKVLPEQRCGVLTRGCRCVLEKSSTEIPTEKNGEQNKQRIHQNKTSPPKKSHINMKNCSTSLNKKK